MIGLRLLVVWCMASLAALACSAPLVTKFELNGSEVGQNQFEAKPDGTFTSSSNLKIGPTTIVSAISGKFVNDRLDSYSLEQSTNGQSFKLVLGDGKLKAISSAGTKEFDIKVPINLLFSNYHPQLNWRVLKAANPNKEGPQSFQVYIIEGGSVQPTTLSIGKAKQVVIDGKSVAVSFATMQFAGLEIQCYFNDFAVVAQRVPSQKFTAIWSACKDPFEDPVNKYSELSQPTYAVKITKSLKIPMRDGTLLAMDVYQPDAPGKFPLILSRTPYGRDAQGLGSEWWVKRGYVFVVQDTRGRGDSDGIFDPFVNERKDGFDTIEWLAKQNYCDGNIGMIGASYGGMVQWAAAAEQPKALKAIIPQVSPPDAYYNIPYDFGVFMLFGNVWWANIVKDKNANMSGVSGTGLSSDKFAILPLSKVDDAVIGRNIPFYDAWLDREEPGNFKGFDWLKDLAKVKIPALHISGWFDGDLIGTMLNRQMVMSGGNKNQWLIYGPWTHFFNSSTHIGERDYGPDSVMELDSIYLRFFDTFLKNKSVFWNNQPKVRAFVTGANQWRTLQDWPDPKSPIMELKLGAPGPANAAASQGILYTGAWQNYAPSRYTYNPANVDIPEAATKVDPDKASLKAVLTSKDQDSLLFKSDLMKGPLNVGGPIELQFSFSTSAVDTDFFAFVVDIDTKGELNVIGQPGKIRTKYLSMAKTGKTKLLVPGSVYEANIRIWDFAHQFAPGHRIGLLITSSMFPTFSRNLNTGEPIKNATKMVTAHQTIYHDAKRPSVLRFRVLP